MNTNIEKENLIALLNLASRLTILAIDAAERVSLSWPELDDPVDRLKILREELEEIEFKRAR